MKDISFLKQNGVDVDKSLELFGDLQIYNETMQDFLDGIEEKKNKLRKFKEADDLPNYAIFAHSIKSDARYLGFTYVAEVCLKHEMAGKESNQHFINSDYDNLINTTNEMINVVKRYLTEPKDEYLNNDVYSEGRSVILVADDSALISNFVTKALKNRYDVVPAFDGQQVIDIINKNEYTILALLLDLNMPNVNGFQVLDYFNDNNLFDKIPVSIISGDDSQNVIKKAFTYPIVDMLNKPFSIDEALRVVEKTIKDKQKTL